MQCSISQRVILKVLVWNRRATEGYSHSRLSRSKCSTTHFRKAPVSFPPAGTHHRAAALLVWQGHAYGQTVSCLPVSGPSISLWGCHTNYHKLGGFTNRNLLSLEVLDQVVNRVMFLLKYVGENPSLLLPTFWQWPSILGFPWFNSCVTSIPTSVMACHSAAVCLLWLYVAIFPLCAQFLLSYKDTNHWIRGQPNPIWLLLNLISS